MLILGNCGVSWSRVYLGVHSPCDVLGGWTIGVLLLFIFGGFADKLYDAYETSSANDDVSFFVYFYSFVILLLWLHPRAWPETQSYGELICVLSGTAAIWCGRVLHLGGRSPSVSLAESHPDAPIYQYFLRFFAGVLLIVVCRVVLKLITKQTVKAVYRWFDMRHYSYTEMCADLGQLQPTKRYTNRMRFKPIPGAKEVPADAIPYDVDLPVKFIVYSAIGFLVSEVCPFVFSRLNI
ncbi:hypothetical protein Q1695_016208 [Nippostrongylus brasiliensis]|nr:hypothetical protein Q1695_016208 [Nippostrongylus brasiliensis]